MNNNNKQQRDEDKNNTTAPDSEAKEGEANKEPGDRRDKQAGR